MDRFVDREEELDRLAALYGSEDPGLAVVYGRRQIGKSELVLESIRDRADAVYYQAIRGTPETQRTRFIEAAAEAYPGITDIRTEWEPLLSYLAAENAVVVIDEFPYLVAADESLPSTIQHLWDTGLDSSSATFVLTGSAIGMMHEHVLDGGAPLYGRVSQSPNGRLELTELPFRTVREFVPSYDAMERVLVYGVFGGTPRYLNPLDPDRTFGENVRALLLNPDGPLHDEPETVLQMELTEVDTYFALLQSMASGNRRRNEIAQGAGVASGNTSYYFDRLETLQVIEADHPALSDPTRSKRSRFRIRDPVFAFYFRYLYGREGRYELYGDGAYEDLLEPEIPSFVSETFEHLCQQAVPTLYPGRGFTRVPTRWWYDGREIDLVAPTDDGTLLVGEAKFTGTPVGYDVLAQLEDDVERIDWTPPGGGEFAVEYALFGRSGFKSSVEEAAEERGDLRLFGLEDVVAALEEG